MSYHDVVFPDTISYGARGGPMFNTTVLALGSGYEKRNINWQQVQARYEVSQGVKEPAQMDELRAFFYARMGRAYSFKYKDWGDYKLEDMTIGTGDGSKTTFQFKKRYTSGAYYYDRWITKLEADTVTGITVGGVAQTEGDDYTIDAVNGRITFDAAPAADADIVVGYAEFYVHVRFDVDYHDVDLLTYGAESWGEIPLVEIKEEVV